MMHHRDALIEEQYKERLPDGSIIEMNIWTLPEATTERPHGYKYRLNFCLPDGTTLVRYDNKTGKGDHKHLKGLEVPYVFTTIDKLTEDFFKDIERMGGEL